VLLAAGNLLAAASGVWGDPILCAYLYHVDQAHDSPEHRNRRGFRSLGAAHRLGGRSGWIECEIPMLMFLVVFLWSPPHFWALALFTKQEYALARIPMLPVVCGEKKTRWQISVYLLLLLPATAYLGIRAELGVVFFVGTTLLGINFVRKLIVLWLRQDDQSARALFHFSIVYLAALFALMILLKW
jgi:heme O synthase-like polyprenyltransferase